MELKRLELEHGLDEDSDVYVIRVLTKTFKKSYNEHTAEYSRFVLQVLELPLGESKRVLVVFQTEGFL